METYTYEYLFELIRTQAEVDSKGVVKPPPSLLSRGLRTINNPTTQNLTNLGKTFMDNIIPPPTPSKPDDINTYIYIHNR